MNRHLRLRLCRRLARAAAPASRPPYNYSDCRRVAERLDCDPNSIARLFALPKFKATQSLSPELEWKIARFLGCEDYEALEKELMLELVWGEFEAYFKQKTN